MLVEELIIELQKLDPKLQVIGAGYRGGYVDINSAETVKIAVNSENAWYYDTIDAQNNYIGLENYKPQDAVFLG
jgi:hypothetical protein